MNASVLVVVATAIALPCLYADLDEHQFKGYEKGELLEQNDWLTQGVAQEGAGYSNLPDRGEVRPGDEKNKNVLVWLSGFAGFEQSRFVKKFPATSDSKCQVEFEIKPGASEAGQLLLDQQNVGSLVIRFVRGGIGLLDSGGESTSQIVDEIKWDKWVKVKLNVDFDSHTAEIFVDGKSVGTHPISESLTAFDQINMFGGGAEFETQLKDLKVVSVTRFK
jgi:hypothetical protein